MSAPFTWKDVLAGVLALGAVLILIGSAYMIGLGQGLHTAVRQYLKKESEAERVEREKEGKL